MRFKVTRPGGLTLLVFAAFIVLAFIGSGAVRIVGFAGAVLVAIALVGGVPFRGASDGYGLTSTERGRTVTYTQPEVLDEAPVDPAAWQRERERREAKSECVAGDDGGPQAPAEAHNPFGGDSSAPGTCG